MATSNVLQQKYERLCKSPSDIHEHLPTLHRYAKECQHITECGVRNVVSSYAFACGLQGKSPNKLIQVDLDTTPEISVFAKECAENGIQTVFYAMSDLKCPMEDTDLLFIDTWHVYGHLKRELARWHKHALKYIILHDTTVDEWQGETIRLNMDAYLQSHRSGIPVSEIRKGLWPAVKEFLDTHSEWIEHERFTNNNGLTILKRIA